MGCCQENKVMMVLKLTSTAKAPTKASGDMCYDVYSDEDATVEYGLITTIKTGIKIALPEGYHYSIRDRSGLAAKHGLHIVAGQIDNSYRGELLICMGKLKSEYNKSLFSELEYGGLASSIMENVKYQIKKGDKIAQFKIERDETFRIIEVDSEQALGSTQRGEKGFGSSGL